MPKGNKEKGNIAYTTFQQDENMKKMKYTKKTYIAPDLEFLSNETMLMVNTWYVDKNDDDPAWEENHPNDWGHIFFDKGFGNYEQDEYNPWDADNW